MATTTMMMTTTKRRTTRLIAEDLGICLLVVRSLASLFKTPAGTLPTLRMSSRTFSQRQKRTSRLYSPRGLAILSNVSINADKSAETQSVTLVVRRTLLVHPNRPTSEDLAPLWVARVSSLEPFLTRPAHMLLPEAPRSFLW